MKAFIVNRVGDLFFMLGLALTFWTFGSVEFSTIFGSIEQHREATFAGYRADDPGRSLCLLPVPRRLGKSAQLGLHTWLPDAMEGPTPGLRADPCGDDGDRGRVHGRAHVAAARAVAGGAAIHDGRRRVHGAVRRDLIGIVQNDIKRVSSRIRRCSQLGYMFGRPLGVGAYSAGAIFHLFTHAFFKALLFLAAGSVIHRHAPRAGHAPHGRAPLEDPDHLAHDSGSARWHSRASGFRSSPD
jgi:NADH-quinone oxidoreductase subunit L